MIYFLKKRERGPKLDKFMSVSDIAFLASSKPTIKFPCHVPLMKEITLENIVSKTFPNKKSFRIFLF